MSVESSNAIDLLLAESLKALAARRPIEKITIREITEKAGVIRPTFYNHFQDKYELLEWIVRRDLMDPVTEMLEGGQIKEAVIRVLGKIQEERILFECLAAGGTEFLRGDFELLYRRAHPGRSQGGKYSCSSGI